MRNMMFRRLVFTAILSSLSYEAMASHPQFQNFNSALHEKIDGKYAMKNQLLVAIHPDTESTNFVRQLNTILKAKGLKATNTEVISSNSAKIEILKLNIDSRQPLTTLRDTVQKIPNVQWVQPNYIYNIGVDPRESLPNDPQIEDQYHHKLMQNIKAWDISTGSNVLIAVTDDGFDIQHEDLVTRFVADKAYNFCDNNTNVTPVENEGGEHGTHVSGIAAAELNNGKGGAGVAGDAHILPIKFYSLSCSWTSDLIYKAYQYSVDNGAKIISTSYNVDKFVGDKVFIAGLDYGYDKGVLHFNSAGNNSEQDPAREAFNELILVASTDENDIKSYFSNYGSGVQISAPGENILSTIPNNKYATMSGTSMATPNAAGSAALIWSTHPSWNRDQVAAQLIGTADNIDNKNPNFKGMIGSGRINNYRALTEQLAPVKVREVIVTTDKKTHDTTIAIHFDKLLSPAIVNKGQHWEIKSLTNSTIIPTKMKHAWFTGSMVLDLETPHLNPGKYQLTLKDSLQDPFGQALDGKGRGVAGGDYIYTFEIK